MKRLLTTMAMAVSCIAVFAQDTSFVQTFTWDSISTRRATFEFPQELESKRFEKVLMYYNLKCDPATPWDSYNCGEWDYLAYTRIFDHTGMLDSVKVESSKWLVNVEMPATLDYTTPSTPLVNKQQFVQKRRSNPLLTNHSVISGTETSTYPLNQSGTGGQKFQMLILASELTAGGVIAGDIQSLMIDGVSTGNAQLSGLSLKVGTTTATALNNWSTSSLTEVYNANRGTGATDDAALVNGSNEFLFYQPFTWNGTDNLIVEFDHTNGELMNESFSTNGVSSATNLSVGYPQENGSIEFDGTNNAISQLEDFDFGNEITVSFWAKGNGSQGTSTSVFEAADDDGNRAVNLHFPWGDNVVYWDAGEGQGYDRINKSLGTDAIDNSWNYWAFTKNATTGVMNIYRNGALWHTGSGNTSPIGKIERFILGSNKSNGGNWKGNLDEFQVWSKALDAATINDWYNKAVDATHPDYANLVLYHQFDKAKKAEDNSANNYLFMPSASGMFDFSSDAAYCLDVSGFRPSISFGQGTVAGALVEETSSYNTSLEEKTLFELSVGDREFNIASASTIVDGAYSYVFDASGAKIDSAMITLGESLTNETIHYYQTPFELVNDIEIGRFITPYGIGFDLGPNGFTWIYDVTDYQQFLKGNVDLAAHNTQELIDVKFAFIEGIPPRDVHNLETIWGKWQSYSYGNLDTDVSLPPVDVHLSETSSNFRLKSRITGHGHEGNGVCCEWNPKDHKIYIDGEERFNWSIWQETECGDNPNIGQGGTWPYAREGWCPGDLVKDKDLELTPFVTPGQTTNIDYRITPVPSNDQGQATGNYVMASHLVSYGAPNHQRDGAIVDVLNPNGWEYYQKWNPTCSNPRVIIQNTGAETMTSAKIRCWISYGNWQEFEWTGNLEFLDKEVVEIPITNNEWWGNYEGELTFTAQIYDVNGPADGDDYANNNVFTSKFEAPEQVNGHFYAWFQSNNKASENGYKLIDASGNTIFERPVGSWTNTTMYRDTFNLDPGCYSIIVEDTDDDGLGFWYSSQTEGETSGWFRIREVGGGIKEHFPVDFGSYHRYDFSVGFELSTEDVMKNVVLDIFPNPNNGQFEISLAGFVGENAVVQVFNSAGQPVYKDEFQIEDNYGSKQVNLNNLAKGLYFVKIVTEKGVYTKEIIKN